MRGSYAQTDKIAFEKYGVAEGLPEEVVSSMIQDDQGFIWVTTQVGLVKFDGYQFKVFKGNAPNADSTNLVLRNLIGGIVKGPDGKLWVGGVLHVGGIASFDPKTEQFRNYHPNDESAESIPFNMAFLLFADSRNNIWFLNTPRARDTTVLVRLDAKTHEISTYHYEGIRYKFNEVSLNGQLLESSADSSIWLLDGESNLSVFDRENDVFELVMPSNTVIPGTNITDKITWIFGRDEDQILLNGEFGFYVWDPISRTCTAHYTNLPDKDNSLSSDKYLGSLLDKRGNYWSTQDNGYSLSLIQQTVQKRN